MSNKKDRNNKRGQRGRGCDQAATSDPLSRIFRVLHKPRGRLSGWAKQIGCSYHSKPLELTPNV